MRRCMCNRKGGMYYGAVKLQLAWNVAYFCVKCGVKRGESTSLRDDKVLEGFLKEDPAERRLTNLRTVLLAG